VKTVNHPEEKHCGNCYYHSVYDYPFHTFCVYRFKQRKNPVVSTLGVCEHWKEDYEKCFCVKEALKKRRTDR